MAAPSKGIYFITGINGFTGKHLESELLKNDCQVFGTTIQLNNNPNHFTCDILEKDKLYEIINEVTPDYIVHLAAISYVAESNKQNIYNVNVFGTLNLIEAINRLSYKPKKVLIASSAAVYGNVEGALDEQICPKPVNHYGNSKLVMENLLRAHFDNQNIIITRPFNYTGIGQAKHFLIPKIVSHFKEKESVIRLGNINVYREFNSIDYIIDCYCKLLNSDVKNSIVNVCSGKESNIENIIQLLAEISTHNIEVVSDPKFVRKNEIKFLIGNPSKLKSLIKTKEEYNLKNTLRKMYLS